MRTHILLALASLLLITSPAPAHAEGDSWLVLTCCSKHRDAGYQEFNPGIGYEKVINNQFSYGLGSYYGSVKNQVLYAGFSWKPIQLGSVKLGIAPTLLLGYSKPWILPLPIVEWAPQRSKWGANLLITPEVVALQLKRRLDL